MRNLLHENRVLLWALAALSAIRLLTLPSTPWEYDEIQFMEAIRDYQPGAGQPHAPGYPLLVGFGKVFAPLFGGPFPGLVALSFLSGVIGFLALATLAQNLARRAGAEAGMARGAGVAAALLYWGSPGLLIHGSLALSDPPALAFLALALWAGERLQAEPSQPGWAIAVAGFAACAIGFRPQLAIALLPFLIVTGLVTRSWRSALRAAASFVAVCLLWFVPLVAEYGGLGTFLDRQSRQAGFVAANDATAARVLVDTETLFERFYVNAWGRRRYALPVFALALLGAALLLRHRVSAAWPLVVMAATHALFCWQAMDPADAPRYGLPVGMLVAVFAGVALALAARHWRATRGPNAWWNSAWPLAAAAAVYVATWLAYTGPFLWARSHTPSPPIQAAEALRAKLERGAIVLVDPRLAPHGREFLPQADRRSADGGIDPFADRPETALWLLADGPAGWPGGETFSWPDTHAFGELTRNLYRVVSVSPIPPERRYQAIAGVYGFEPSMGSVRWRWLDREATIRLHRGEFTAVRLSLGQGPESPANQTQIFVAGRPAGLVVLRPGERTSLEVDLPAEATVDLQFVSQSAFRSPEGRSLAVQLTGLELFRREAPGAAVRKAAG